MWVVDKVRNDTVDFDIVPKTKKLVTNCEVPQKSMVIKQLADMIKERVKRSHHC